jgi:hypothetical protein
VGYAGNEQGKGAHMEWSSDKRSVGNGSMDITDSAPNRRVDLAVTFNGMDGTGYFDIAPSGSGSKVTWGFGVDMGTNPFRRWKGLMLDRIVGTEYRDGLAKLKERIEVERQPIAPPTPPAGTTVPPSAAVPPGTAAPATGSDQAVGSTPPAQTPPQAAAPAPAPQPAPPASPPAKKKKR